MNPETVDDLRDAWLATIAAADRAGAQLHGAGPPGRRLPWQDAVTECWRALSPVYAGLAALAVGCEGRCPNRRQDAGRRFRETASRSAPG